MAMWTIFSEVHQANHLVVESPSLEVLKNMDVALEDIA